jgi:endonuclease G
MNIQAFAEEIAAAEERFAGREDARTETLRKLDEGGILAADEPERVDKRLARLGTDRDTATAVARGAVPLGSTLTEADAAEIAALGTDEVEVTTVETGETDFIALVRLLSANDLISAAFLAGGARASRAVGRIIICAEGGRVTGYGTGSLISPNLVLTNNHVLEDVQSAAQAQIEFDYELGLDGTPAQAASFKLDPDRFFLTSRELDYSLVAVEEQDSVGGELATFGWNQVIEAEGKVILGEQLNIVQHPNGEPKQLAMRENQLLDLLDNYLHYKTDTAPGSSGSPVFNDQWEIVGLHHSGVPLKDESGRILAIGGGLWTRAMGEHRIDWVANEGVRISRIIKDVKKQKLTGGQSRLRDQLFEGGPPERPPARTVEAATVAGPQLAVAPASTNGPLVWTIPLQVTVQVGAPISHGRHS